MNKATNKATNRKRKPVRRARRWGGQVLPMAGKLLMIAVACVVMGLMFSALQAIESAFLRGLLSLSIASGMLLMCLSEGLSKGARDTEASRLYVKTEKEGGAPGAKADAACYHPLKAVCAALAVYGVPLALAVYLAAVAKPYTYVLQDLPAWLTGGFASRSDVMAPLAAYCSKAPLVAQDFVRMAVRMMELIYVNLFADPQTAGQLIDRLSPLMIGTFPLAYVVGYLCGPREYDKRQSMQRRAKKAAVRKAQKKRLADELIGGGAQVHYGQRQEEVKHKKKELI